MQGIEIINKLTKRIKRTLLEERLIIFSAGLIGIVSVLILTSILLSLLAGIFILPIWLKVELLAFSGLVSIYLFWKLVFSRLFSSNIETTALKLERRFPELKGRLIAALQFSDKSVGEIEGYSTDLISATLIQAGEKSTGLNYNKVISAYPIWRNLKTLMVSSVLAVLLLVIFPGFFSYSYEVFSNPTKLITPPLGYRLTSYPGNSIAVKYRDVDIGGVLQGDRFPERATVFYKFTGGIWKTAEIDLSEWKREISSFGDSLIFTIPLRQVRRSFEYYIRVGRITTPLSQIDVVDRPRVTGIKLSFFYPDYTGLSPTVIDENDGNISVVFGTRINIKIETNLPMTSAEMVFNDSSRSRFEINGLTGEQSLRIEKDRSYYIRLVDRQDEVNPDPIEYYITAIPDEYPVIDVIRPGVDINLNEEMIVPLLLRISDDYGFSSLVLKYSLVSNGNKSDESVAVLHFSDHIETEGEINFNWDVEPLNLIPSDYIIYYFELADNDRISGPKITTSREYIARLPSLEEIIAQTEREQGQNINRAEEYLKSHQELSERLKNIARKMEQDRSKSDQKLSWQQQKELEEIADQEAKIAEQIKETAEKMEKMIGKMEENRLSGRDLLEKLAEIQKLFEEIASPEMKAARLKLLEALKNMDPQQIEEALRDFQMSQEELMEQLDRTIALLKKMKIEQKVNEMTELARQLAEEQEKMNDRTSESKPENLPSLIPGEKKVEQGFDTLKKEASKLREMLKEIPYSKANIAEEFLQAVEQNDAGQNMNRMTQNMSDKKKEATQNEGDKALSKLLELVDKMQQGQAGMCGGDGSEMAEKMRRTINDINYLSNEEEKLINEASTVRNSSEVLRDLAARQQVLRESVSGLYNRIVELGKESPFVAAELNSLIKTAIGNIDYAIDKFSDRRGQAGLTFQKDALYNLNRAAVRMMDALEAQSKCNKGGNCNKPSQMMNSLCDKQNRLNQKTQSQCQNPGSQMKPGEGDALRQLAGEQNAIGKSLSQLQQEFGNSREILGRLDAIANDMKKVAEALDKGEIGRETLERQLKIYSRMLDATRTLQRKDFTEQRRARIGKDILRSSPATLSGSQLRGGLDIEDRLRQFLDENYPAEYEQHIKAYFKALLESIDTPPPRIIYESK